MIHKCEKCGSDAIIFKYQNCEPEILCLRDWHCWGANPTNPKEIESGEDAGISESRAMINDFFAVFDKHSAFMSRLLATRGFNYDGQTNFMMQVMIDAFCNLYIFRWPSQVKDLRAIRSALFPHAIKCIDQSLRGVEDANKPTNVQSNIKFDA